MASSEFMSWLEQVSTGLLFRLGGTVLQKGLERRYGRGLFTATAICSTEHDDVVALFEVRRVVGEERREVGPFPYDGSVSIDDVVDALIEAYNTLGTRVLFVIPGGIRQRIDDDLEIREAVKEEYLQDLLPYENALGHYEFCFAGWTNRTHSEMIAFVEEVVQQWPNIAYAVYLDPRSFEGALYVDFDKYRQRTRGRGGLLQPEHVTVDDLMTEFDSRGIPSTPMRFEYDDVYNDPSWYQLRLPMGVTTYRESLELITSIPRVLYRRGKLVFPDSDIWRIDDDRDLFRYLAKKSAKVFDMSPREFEKFIASIYHARGFDVSLTPESRDGGFDVLAIQKSSLTGDNHYLIECKRYKQARKVGVGLVQRLVGAVNQHHATRGILVTTSSFSRDAEASARSTAGIVTLRDYDNIKAWLREIVGEEDH